MKKPDKQPQLQKFVQAAKEHDCDESEKAFSDKLKKIVKNPTEKK